MERKKVRENRYHCLNCYQIFSFHSGELKVQETKTIIPQAGTNTQRSQRSRANKHSNRQPKSKIYFWIALFGVLLSLLIRK